MSALDNAIAEVAGGNRRAPLPATTFDRTWPTLDPVAFHGPLGEAVKIIEPETEADPAAVVVTLLTGFGAMIGSGPYVKGGPDKHRSHLYALIVGDTARGAKGTSLGEAARVLDRIDPIFWATRRMSGFGSGEILVDAVADGDDTDAGAKDKRLLVVEPEFTRVMRSAAREGSILSPVMRDAWDEGRMESRSRAKTSVATGAHVCAVGHVVPDELRRYLSATDVSGGFANRMLYICSKRQRLLPEGGDDVTGQLAPIVKVLRERLDWSRRIGEVKRAPAAVDRWDAIYRALDADSPGGMLGDVCGRGAQQVLRLSLLYALADGAREIDLAHIEAAHAIWLYSRASAEYVFGDAVGDALVDKLLAVVRQSPRGISASDLERHARNVSAKRRGDAMGVLVQRELVTVEVVGTTGRPMTVYRPVT